MHEGIILVFVLALVLGPFVEDEDDQELRPKAGLHSFRWRFNKFLKDRILRDERFVDRFEAVQELQQFPGFFVPRVVVGERADQRLRQWFEDGDLITQRRVVFLVREGLKRKNPLILTRPHGWPEVECFFHRITTEVMVTDHAAHHPVIGARNARVVVEHQRGARSDVDFQRMSGVDKRCNARIQSVDALEQCELIRFQADDIAPELAAASQKLKVRHLDGVAVFQLSR